MRSTRCRRPDMLRISLATDAGHTERRTKSSSSLAQRSNLAAWPGAGRRNLLRLWIRKARCGSIAACASRRKRDREVMRECAAWTSVDRLSTNTEGRRGAAEFRMRKVRAFMDRSCSQRLKIVLQSVVMNWLEWPRPSQTGSGAGRRDTGAGAHNIAWRRGSC